ncbi:hemolysin family protein [Desulfovibrio inopinatus]|uniref:hemolysin family protein n=1 Tax=Desulfovibrio inopinatus TaxID=102109 RepID=UPI00040FAF7E|nr:hemolysin family protein [Desulfovibrio inopinatus]
MIELVVAVTFAVLASAFCSVSEAALYSIPWSWIETLRKSGKKSGEDLYRLRSQVERPITAILTLNTFANIAGASLAGAAAVEVMGEQYLWIFTLGFTALILVFGEIIPKTVGVVYNRNIAGVMGPPLRVLVFIMAPIIWVGGLLVKIVDSGKKGPQSTEEDIFALASLTRKAGVIKPYEELSIKNILTLDKKVVRDIMTPRTVVFSLPADMTVAQAREYKSYWPHSRIPVYENDDAEDVVGIVYRRQVLEALANDQDDVMIGDLMKPVQFALETMTLDRLLIKFLESRMHLFVVLDEYGGVGGVVSLEDVLEEILGKEIVDETDQVADMRELARIQRESLLNQGGNID